MSFRKKHREYQHPAAQRRTDAAPDEPKFLYRAASVIYAVVPVLLALIAWLVFLQHITRLLLFAAAPNSHLALGQTLSLALEGLAVMVTGWFLFSYVFPSVSSGRESLARQRLNPAQDLPLPKEVLIDWFASQGLSFAITLIVAGPSLAHRLGVPAWVGALLLVTCVVWAVRKGVLLLGSRRSTQPHLSPNAMDLALGEALLQISTKLHENERKELEEGTQFIQACSQVSVRSFLIRVILGTLIVALLYELGEQVVVKLLGG